MAEEYYKLIGGSRDGLYIRKDRLPDLENFETYRLPNKGTRQLETYRKECDDLLVFCETADALLCVGGPCDDQMFLAVDAGLDANSFVIELDNGTYALYEIADTNLQYVKTLTSLDDPDFECVGEY